jgi:hypothetical protein
MTELDCTGRGIDPGDRVLPTFGDPGGTVGRNDHAVGCRSRTQRDQIRFPGPGIEPAEFARGLRGEPDCAVRRGKDVYARCASKTNMTDMPRHGVRR